MVKIVEKLSTEEFDSYVAKRLSDIELSLVTKGREYSRNNDRLHNFNEGSKITGQSRERVLDGFLMKHLISYRDILDDIDKKVNIDPNYIKEKFGDIINYFILQEIQCLERYKQ